MCERDAFPLGQERRQAQLGNKPRLEELGEALHLIYGWKARALPASKPTSHPTCHRLEQVFVWKSLPIPSFESGGTLAPRNLESWHA